MEAVSVTDTPKKRDWGMAVAWRGRCVVGAEGCRWEC